MAIKLGVRWPDLEIPIDRAAVRDFVQAAEGLGFDHVTTFDHLAGMSRRTRRGWTCNYPVEKEWFESLTLISYMSSITERLGFMTAVMGLPARPTFLVAKQAATIDRLSGGRLRLGISTGWNDIEYDLLGANFEDRASRIEEQIDVLRALWTKKTVLFRGRWHQLPFIGLSLAPTQRPIPIWMGAANAPAVVIRRIARYADGVIPEWDADESAIVKLNKIRDEATKIGRDPNSIGLEPKIDIANRPSDNRHRRMPLRDDEDLATEIKFWVEVGATHLELKMRPATLDTVEAHIREMTRFKQIADSILG